ncbi:hypothetical protein CA266_23890 (plasmid) [Serratia marcescens]|uniref:hypothetical protein n=1 Tax=Serratia marcescens TaxID=615 RepID=UPI00187FF208|nr:hypothetical protein [Serratia marcescens]QOV56306.1 hypothetical protein CA266_23890 [Serratia marcescens]
MLKLIIILLICSFFNIASAETNGYPGLICSSDTYKKNNLSVVALQSDNYNGYSYIQFKDSSNNKLGGFVYTRSSSYNEYVQEAIRIATMAYLLNLKVNVCLYESSFYSNSVRAIELAP